VFKKLFITTLFLLNFTQPATGQGAVKVISAARKLYTATRGEVQLISCAALSHRIWRRLQTPAWQTSSLAKRRALAFVGLTLALNAYHQIQHTGTYAFINKEWDSMPTDDPGVAELKSFADQTAYPLSILSKFCFIYYLSTSFFGTPEKLISPEQAARVVASIFAELLVVIFKIGLSNFSILSSESIRPTYPHKKFSNLAGSPPEELIEIIQDIEEGFSPEGILLYGKPGNGKTAWVEAFAGETQLPLFNIKAADIKRDGNSNAEANLINLFNTAAAYALQNHKQRAVIFIDELEMLGRRRNSRTDGNNASLTGTLLYCISRYQNRIIVIGCTNYPELLDPALTRDERIGTPIEIELPGVSLRKLLFEQKLGQDLNTAHIDSSKLARLTEGQTVAFIVEAMRQAYKLARRSKQTINQELIENVIQKRLTAQRKLRAFNTEPHESKRS
jgi:hypothetical protein